MNNSELLAVGVPEVVAKLLSPICSDAFQFPPSLSLGHHMVRFKSFKSCLCVLLSQIVSFCVGTFPINSLLSGDTQFHMTIGRVSKHFNLHTHAVMMPLSQVTIGRTSKSLDPRLFAVTMVLSQVTIGRTSKPFDPRVSIFPLIIVQPLLVG